MMVATAEAKQQAQKTVRALRKLYPRAECALEFSNPLELLVATILSAQCTDQRVNLVTRDLFRRYRSAADYARAPVKTLQKVIQSAGFFRNKAKSIKTCCALLAEEYDGQVPRDLEALVELPGVGRKTANVVLGTAYGIASGVVVDTHVGRLSRRLGLTKEKTAEKVEEDLIRQLPKKEWIIFSHRMIQHGRRVCMARKPDCAACSMARFCPQVGVGS